MISWKKLEAAVLEQITGRPDLQVAARAAVRWLEEHSLDSASRLEHAARYAMGSGDVA